MTHAAQAELLPSVETVGPPRYGDIPTYTIDDLSELDLERRTTLPTVSRQIGQVLSRHLIESSTTDNALTISKEDRERVQEESLQSGLYIYEDDPRYVDASELVTVRSRRGVAIARGMRLTLPFEADFASQPAVVFPSDEYSKVARSPYDLVKATMANTRNAKQKANLELPEAERLSGEEIEKEVKASARAVLRTYIESTEDLESEYLADGSTLSRINRQTQGIAPGETKTPQNQYKGINLVKEIRRAEEMFRETIEVAAINNNWGNKQVAGAHNALTKGLYRGISPRENVLVWRSMTSVQEDYINSRRFKLLQARARCEDHLRKHAKKE
ncbi:hypothetical protein KC963_04730 [Candidatus Saccharibacteria bacterium]|nr:hypothetical protein [Candidatus Saccharibacteria bacterium]